MRSITNVPRSWLAGGIVAVLVLAGGVAWAVPELSSSSSSASSATSGTGSTASEAAPPAAGLWTGNSITTMSRGDDDMRVGYTMRGDFWFRVDEDGAVSGHGHAAYQPTFDAAGMNAKINVAKSMTSGAASLLPGGGLGWAKAAMQAINATGNAGLAGLVGVTGQWSDPQPIRSGEITGRYDEATGAIHLEWVDDEQGAPLPIAISLTYITSNEELADEELAVWTPWHEPAVVGEGSDGWLATSGSEEDTGGEDEPSGSVRQHWTAQRVGSLD